LREVELEHERRMRISSKPVDGNLKLKDRSEEDSLIIKLEMSSASNSSPYLRLANISRKTLKMQTF
jgi:hypothetical protein